MFILSTSVTLVIFISSDAVNVKKCIFIKIFLKKVNSIFLAYEKDIGDHFRNHVPPIEKITKFSL